MRKTETHQNKHLEWGGGGGGKTEEFEPRWESFER